MFLRWILLTHDFIPDATQHQNFSEKISLYPFGAVAGSEISEPQVKNPNRHAIFQHRNSMYRFETTGLAGLDPSKTCPILVALM